jgi:hypothetical protein
MVTKEEIAEIVKKKIADEEKPGELAGESGHLGYKSFELKNIDIIETDNTKVEVIYDYIVTVETEFTYFPDNPPYQYSHRKLIIINSEGKIISETEIDNSVDKNSINNKEWLETQEKINSFLTDILLKIEWHYGEGRAPFVFPAEFITIPGKDLRMEYRCIITLEFNEGEKLEFNSEIPSEILNQVKKDFEKRFLSFE